MALGQGSPSFSRCTYFSRHFIKHPNSAAFPVRHIRHTDDEGKACGSKARDIKERTRLFFPPTFSEHLSKHFDSAIFRSAMLLKMMLRVCKVLAGIR